MDNMYANLVINADGISLFRFSWLHERNVEEYPLGRKKTPHILNHVFIRLSM